MQIRGGSVGMQLASSHDVMMVKVLSGVLNIAAASSYGFFLVVASTRMTLAVIS
jgi:hypothetical protein